MLLLIALRRIYCKDFDNSSGNTIARGAPRASTDAKPSDGVLRAVFMVEHDVQVNVRLDGQRIGEGDVDGMRFAVPVADGPAGATLAVDGVFRGPILLGIVGARLAKTALVIDFLILS